MSTLALTDQAHLEAVLKRAGLQSVLAQDDLNAPVDPLDLANAITRGSADVYYYLGQRYNPQLLLGNDWVMFKTAVLVAVQLVRRDQAEQSGLQREYKLAIEQLKDIQHNKPGCEVPLVSPLSEPGAWHSNARVAQNFGVFPIRVSSATSSNEQTSKFPRQYDPYDVWIDIL